MFATGDGDSELRGPGLDAAWGCRIGPGQPRRKRLPRRSGWRSERGVALLIVVWIFIVLFVVVLDFATSMRDDGLATANFADEAQVYYIALAGINRAIYDVLGQLQDNDDLFLDEDDDSDAEDDGDIDDAAEADDVDDGEVSGGEIKPDGAWHDGRFGVGSYTVRLLDESSKIGLNWISTPAGQPLLQKVIETVWKGGDPTEGVRAAELSDISALVGAIMDWRDPDDEKSSFGQGAEAGDYDYPIKNGPFDSVEELLQVKGVTPELFYGAPDRVGLQEVFSVENRTQYVNIMQAPRAVLQVLFNLDQTQAEELVALREEQSLVFQEHVRSLPEYAALARMLRARPSPILTVEARGMMGERNVAHVAVVVDLRDTFEGPLVLKWLDRVPAGWGGHDADDEEEGEEGF